jgi:hypothetical protein
MEALARDPPGLHPLRLLFVMAHFVAGQVLLGRLPRYELPRSSEQSKSFFDSVAFADDHGQILMRRARRRL